MVIKGARADVDTAGLAPAFRDSKGCASGGSLHARGFSLPLAIMAEMTHRERLVAAVNHRQPDRVPVDFASTRDSSIVVEGYRRLKQHFGVQGEDNLTSRMMQVVNVDERVLQALDVDARGVFPPAPPDELIGEDRYRDEWGVERVRPEGAYYFDQVRFPLAGDITRADILGYPWPEPQPVVRRKGIKDRIREIHAAGYAAVLNLQSGFVHTSQYLRGFEDWFADFAGDRKLLEMLFDAILEASLAISRELLDEAGGEADILMASDDLGLQGGLMVSPEAYREVIKPRHERYFRLIHDMAPGKVFFHTCGSVADIIEDMIEIGVDILHPVQVTAAGMAPAHLKRKYGADLTFWGAVDTQHVLPHGSVRDVENEVERRIEELGEGGGYVLGAVHNVQPDVSVDNLLAMYRRAREYKPSFSR